MFTRKEYKQILAMDRINAFPWECLSAQETKSRKVNQPATNLGAGRGRFWEILKSLSPHTDRKESLIDFGAYPGTLLRLLRSMPGGEETHLAAGGFGYSLEFQNAMQQLKVPIFEMEFDVRYPLYSGLKHILSHPVGKCQLFDVGVCMEVIEHQMYPLSLMTGMNRFIKLGGSIYLTTNSVSFIGDIIKLVLGRHNVEEIQYSHILNDNKWRPHIRLFTLPEVELLLQMAGFRTEKSYYFDSGGFGGIYTGIKGMSNSSIRIVAKVVPRLQSHIFVAATKMGPPSEDAISIIKSAFDIFNLGDVIRA